MTCADRLALPQAPTTTTCTRVNSAEALDVSELEDELESRETELTGKDSRIATLEEEVAALTARLASKPATQVSTATGTGINAFRLDGKVAVITGGSSPLSQASQ